MIIFLKWVNNMFLAYRQDMYPGGDIDTYLKNNFNKGTHTNIIPSIVMINKIWRKNNIKSKLYQNSLHAR